MEIALIAGGGALVCSSVLMWALRRLGVHGSLVSVDWREAPPQDTARLARLSKIVLSAYEADVKNPRFTADYGFIDVIKQVRYHSGKLHCPPYVIAVDHASKQVCVAVKGMSTHKPSHYATFLRAWQAGQPLGDGFVHRGFYLSAQWLLEAEAQTLSNLLDQYPAYNLCFLGHSLGAGVAVTAALLLLTREPQLTSADAPGMTPEEAEEAVPSASAVPLSDEPVLTSSAGAVVTSATDGGPMPSEGDAETVKGRPQAPCQELAETEGPARGQLTSSDRSRLTSDEAEEAEKAVSRASAVSSSDEPGLRSSSGAVLTSATDGLPVPLEHEGETPNGNLKAPEPQTSPLAPPQPKSANGLAPSPRLVLTPQGDVIGLCTNARRWEADVERRFEGPDSGGKLPLDLIAPVAMSQDDVTGEGTTSGELVAESEPDPAAENLPESHRPPMTSQNDVTVECTPNRGLVAASEHDPAAVENLPVSHMPGMTSQGDITRECILNSEADAESEAGPWAAQQLRDSGAAEMMSQDDVTVEVLTSAGIGSVRHGPSAAAEGAINSKDLEMTSPDDVMGRRYLNGAEAADEGIHMRASDAINVSPSRIRCVAFAPPQVASKGLCSKYASNIESVILQDDFLSRTSLPLHCILGSAFCLPCAMAASCLKDTFMPNQYCIDSDKRLRVSGTVYHIVYTKCCSCTSYPPVVKQAIPDDGNFDQIVCSMNAIQDHFMLRIRDKLACAAKESAPMDCPAEQMMRRTELLL